MTSTTNTLRSFVAIELPAECRAYLAQAQSTLQRSPGGNDLRWVSPDSMHLTLQFLGNVPETQVSTISQALQEATQTQQPFSLHLGRIGWFPARGPLRVLWMGLEGDIAALTSLQQVVERSLSALGFKPEERGFSPHLTLARVRQGRRVNSDAFQGAATPQATRGEAAIPVEGIVLMRSDLRPQGPLYTPLWRGRLIASRP